MRSRGLNDRSGGLSPSIASIIAANFAPSPWPYIVLMMGGFVVGTFGHIIKSNTLIATGIGMVFTATLLLPLLFHLT